MAVGPTRLSSRAVRRRLRRAGATIAGGALLASVAGLVTPPRTARADTTFDVTLFNLLNQDRAQNGLPPLQWNDTLAGIAERSPYSGCGYQVNGRAQDMVDRNYFSHTILNCGTQNVFSMMGADNLPFGWAGENIGWLSGVSDPVAAATALNTMFMNSSEHRANILSPNYTHVAIGSAWSNSWTGNGGAPLGNVFMTAEEFASLPASLTSQAPALVQSGPPTAGYWLAASDGGIFSFGTAGFLGGTGGDRLNASIVGESRTGDGGGYWLVASDGGVFSFGDAGFHGSTGGQHLNAPIVGMASTPDGGGYWLVASDGGVFAFGDARFHGSTGGQRLNAPIVGIASTPDGGGYWLVASDGGIFSFGDAGFHGSAGGHGLNAPIVSIAATHDGGGYWLVASDGGVFSYGDAQFHGGMGGTHLNRPIVGMAPTDSGAGYWMVASDGGVFSFGDAAFEGSTGGMSLNRPIISMAAR